MAFAPSSELVEFLESGVSIIACTRDAALVPHAMRACGARWAPAEGRLHVFLQAGLARQQLADVQDNGALAVTFVRIYDYHGVQLKGRVARWREATPEERPVPERHLVAFGEQLYFAGVPRCLSRRQRVWPAVVLELEVEALFHQTPGPRAGTRLEAHEA